MLYIYIGRDRQIDRYSYLANEIDEKITCKKEN